MTKAEEKRLAEFEAMSDRLIAEGYRRTDLQIDIVKANIFSVGLMIVYGLLAAFLFFMVHISGGVSFDIPKMLLFVVLIFVLIVVHELIHGATWAIFSEHHWKDISFGFMVKTLTPYCTCKTPLGKWQYIAGALMPLILLGIVPTVVAIFNGSFLTLLLGIVMVAGAAGDILIVWKFLRHQVTGQEVLYIDHPTAAGSVVFER